MVRVAFTHAKTVLLAGGALVVLGAWGLQKIDVNDNPVKWFKKAHPMRVADTVMNRLFAGTYMAYVALEGDRPEIIKNPDVVSYIDSLQAYLEDDPVVGKTSSVADIVKRINLVLHDNDSSYDIVPYSADAVGHQRIPDALGLVVRGLNRQR